jgi:hypothetical protein
MVIKYNRNKNKNIIIKFMVLESNKRKKIKIPYGSIHNKKSHERRGWSPYQGLHFTHVLHGLV